MSTPIITKIHSSFFSLVRCFSLYFKRMGALTWLFPFLLYFLQYQVAASSSSPLSSFASSAHPLCRHDQRSPLLQFKHMFTVKSSASSECGEESYPKTLSWDENATNCCDWDGVTCDELTGHVVGLDLSCSQLYGTIQPNSSLFQLSHLQRLNLAHNHFNGSRISYAFGNLASLTHLNLSFSVFSGSIPSELSLLRKLISLDLSYFLLSLERLHFKIFLKNLTRLQELVLHGVNISSGLPDSLSNLTSLTTLDLSSTELIGNLPDGVFHLPNLQKLVLIDNLNLDINLPKSTWGSGGSLRVLDLSKTSLSGELPDSIGNLKSFKSLDLSGTSLYGELPDSIGYLKSLKSLDLSGTNISGELPDSIGYLKSLKSLDLFETSLSGELPDSIGNLKSLKFLRLSGTSLSGKLPDSIGNLKSLNYLNLAWCKLRGSIPKSLGNLTQIRELYLSGNDFTGEVPSTISNLKQLTHLYLRHNNFTGPIPFNLSGLQNLRELYLYNNSLSGVIPPSLFTLMSLEDLKLSCNHLTGQIPEFQHHLPLERLNLSHNFLTDIKQLPWEQLDTLDLRSNLLQGPLPIPPPLIRFFFISNNNLSGEIPSLICNASSLVILDLSHNKLSGAAPQCLGNFSSVLSVLNLCSNRFTGTLPLAFAKPNPLQSLDLSGNHFEGPLPRSLKNCTWLEVLNVGNNKINDTFPNWLGTLPRLQVLVVRSNRFHGHINTTMSEFSFPKLRIVDLSYNEFTGHLPTRYFENFQAMKNITTVSGEQYMSVGDSSYHDSLIVTMKGHEFELVRILTIFTTIDFSCNNFSGEIPNVVGKLNSLILLNFSHNSLTGNIPASLGNLSNLESLDISFNQLTGKIPSQLTSLTFLAVLNLSRNRLHGPIPRGKQFATFENGSYAGNLGLCGFPLSKECQDNRTKVQPPVLQHEEDDSDFDGFFWKVVVIGYGCGMTLGLFLGSLMFLIGRPRFFVKLAERKLPKKVILLRS